MAQRNFYCAKHGWRNERPCTICGPRAKPAPAPPAKKAAPKKKAAKKK